MITRRNFLKKTSMVVLAGFGVGVKPFGGTPKLTSGGVVPKNISTVLTQGETVIPTSLARPSARVLDNFGIERKQSISYVHAKEVLISLDDGVEFSLDGRTHRNVTSMPKLDNVGVDTKRLRQLFDGGDTDAIVAAKLIQTLDPDNFDSLAQYSECIVQIAREFGL